MKLRRLAALFLALSLLSACGGENRATEMYLRRTDGAVAVQDEEGAPLDLRENLGLYSGYQVDTEEKSYAWIDLDHVKLTKMDADTQVEIQREDKALTIHVARGSLYFHVTEPLEADESLDIRTSSMTVGIRGTCGWVDAAGTAALLEGSAEIAAGAETLTLEAGQKAAVDEKGGLSVTDLTTADIPAFVADEAPEDLLSTLPAPVELLPLPDDGIDRTVLEVEHAADLQNITSNMEVHFRGETYDVANLDLRGLRNVTLVGDGTTRLISSWGGDLILTADETENLILCGLVMGHDLPEAEGCDVGVVSAWDVENLQIIGCDIYGCGVVGVSGSGSMTLRDTTVRDCSAEGLFWTAGEVRAVDCAFRGNGYLDSEFPLFHLREAARLVLENCTIEENHCVQKCALPGLDEAGNPIWIPAALEETGTVESGNAWQ